MVWLMMAIVPPFPPLLPPLLTEQLFHLVVSGYQAHCKSVEVLKQRGMDIYWTFLLDHAPLRLDVEDALRQKICELRACGCDVQTDIHVCDVQTCTAFNCKCCCLGRPLAKLLHHKLLLGQSRSFSKLLRQKGFEASHTAPSSSVYAS